MTDTLTATLEERGKRYGKFVDHAAITQLLKDCINDALDKRSKVLVPDQQEALDMICHKIGRIINGDPNYIDHWRDICGYSQLVVDELAESDGASDARVSIVKRSNGAWT